jgi:hypothetical protein
MSLRSSRLRLQVIAPMMWRLISFAQPRRVARRSPPWFEHVAKAAFEMLAAQAQQRLAARAARRPAGTA